LRFSLDDIRNSYMGQKGEQEKKFPLWYYGIRRLSFYPTWVALRLGVSANQVTVFSLLIVLCGSVFLAFGYNMWVCIGSVLLNVFLVFDCIDGNIARVTGTSSPYGRHLDGMVGVVLSFAPFLTVGIALYNAPDDKLSKLINLVFSTEVTLGRELFLFLGVANALFSLLGQVNAARYSELILNEGKGAMIEEPKKVGTILYSSSLPSRLAPLYLIYINVVGEQGIWTQWLVVAAFTKSLSIFVAFYAVAHLLDLLIVETWHIRRIRQIIGDGETG